MYKLTLNLPNLSQGSPVELDGLGVFENGKEYLIEKDAADSFRQRHTSAHSVYDDKERYVGDVFTIGPTLVEAFKDTVGIDVEVYHPKVEEDKVTRSKAKAKTNEGGES